MPAVTTAQVDARAAKAGLPSGWRDLPTTSASEAVTVWAITQEYGSAKGAAFKSWYDAARKKDPAITPNQAVANWVTGTTLQGAIGAEGSLVGSQVPQAAANAAEKLAVSNPLAAIASFFAALTQGATWIRVAKVVTGGALLIIGLAHMTGASNAVANTARKVPLPV